LLRSWPHQERKLPRWDFLDGPGLSGICNQSTGPATAILDVRSTGTTRL